MNQMKETTAAEVTKECRGSCMNVHRYCTGRLCMMRCISGVFVLGFVFILGIMAGMACAHGHRHHGDRFHGRYEESRYDIEFVEHGAQGGMLRMMNQRDSSYPTRANTLIYPSTPPTPEAAPVQVIAPMMAPAAK